MDREQMLHEVVDGQLAKFLLFIQVKFSKFFYLSVAFLVEVLKDS